MTYQATDYPIDRHHAEQLIQFYCADEPHESAMDRLMYLHVDALHEQESNDWVRIIGDLGMRQDALDALLYGEDSAA